MKQIIIFTTFSFLILGYFYIFITYFNSLNTFLKNNMLTSNLCNYSYPNYTNKGDILPTYCYRSILEYTFSNVMLNKNI